jgi:glycosyltransferase involved in cell wall biosynthesis
MSAIPNLTVVIPVYNGVPYIAATIESVIENSAGFDVECIVVNDGSTDDTALIIEEFRDKIKIITQANSGESAAVNRGIEEARGDGILVVSADDPLLTPRIFEGMSRRLADEPTIVAWYPDWLVIDHAGKLLKSTLLASYDFRDLFEKNKVLPGPGTWFRKSAALSIGGRDTKWRYVGDYDFWLRLAMQGSFIHRPEILAQWRSHPASTSISQRGQRMAEERIEVIESFVEKYHDQLKGYSASLARANAHYLAARLGFFSLQVNSRKLFINAIKLNFRVLKSAKIHEVLFMLTFPVSKIAVDKLQGKR